MKPLIYIEVEDITGLEFEPNFIIKDLTTGFIFQGNGTSSPPVYYNSDNLPSTAFTVSYKNATYTIVSPSEFIEADGTFTVNLTTADGFGFGMIGVKNIGAGTITIDPYSTETIDSASSITLSPLESVLLVSNSTVDGWLVVASKADAVGGSGTTVNTGEATLSFGSTPTNEATVTITGQTSILTTSKVQCWIMGATTSDNNESSHLFGGISINLVSSIPVASTGFTIYASTIVGYVTGDFKVKWSWI